MACVCLRAVGKSDTSNQPCIKRLHEDQLQWEFSIIILPSMPYVFLYEDWFVGIIAVLILGLLILRYMIARKRD